MNTQRLLPGARRWGSHLLLAAALLGAGPLTTAAATELGSNVQDLLDQARAQNPELALMRAEAEAATQRVQPAAALPDPVLRVELMNVNNYGNEAGFNLLPSKVGETKYTLMQMLPWPGKLGLRRDIANADVRQAQARTAAAWTELAMRIKTAYARYYLAAGNERLTREILDLMQRVEQIAQARYAGGLVAQQDAIRAQLEQTAMRSELIMLESDKRQQRARLNALLARDAGAPLAEPQALRPLPAPGSLDAAMLAQRARANNPQLASEEARLAGAEKNRELARRNRYPDLTVGLQPTQMGSRITSWGIMVEMNIPLQQTTRRSQEAEAEAMVGAARARAQNVANQLAGELGESVAALDAARRSEVLIATQSLPQSELSLRSAIAAYENGKLDFTALLEAQRQIRKTRQERLKAQAEAQMRLAEIERLVGEEL
ncbi:TolC family protein [Ramlibacter sp.]|uniref:TolC family protein n=1 Tax=Ramlibacter sp. TaxID=1917967 RepID=UPI002CB935EB|nr:TolC family protein [Ramlibacter sp.]HWI82935.1 TolC family protein [Ramlibacter sp.]